MAAIVPELDRVDPGSEFCDIRDVHERVGRALMQMISLSHRIAFLTRPDGAALTTVADLREIRPEVLDVTDDAAPCLAQVGQEAGRVWAWFRFLNEAESATQVRPNGVDQGQPGMWMQQHLPEAASCATHRYLPHVEYCAAQVDSKNLWNRCRGKTPSVFVSPMGEDEIKENSQTYAFHRHVLRYQIRALSANWRGGVTARMTPPIVDDQIGDPGTMRILGDIRRLLIHDNSLMGVVGVEKISLGTIRNVFEKDAERVIVDAMDVRCIAYSHTPNTPCEIVSPWRMWIQLQDELGVNAGPPNQLPRPTDGP